MQKRGDRKSYSIPYAEWQDMEEVDMPFAKWQELLDAFRICIKLMVEDLEDFNRETEAMLAAA